MAQTLKASTPIVGRATCLHYHVQRLAILKHPREGISGKTLSLNDAVVGISKRQFEDVFCQVE